MTNNRDVRAVSSGGRIPELDGVRALAIVLVVAVHVTGGLGLENVTQGQLGVDAFLIVSGFLLAFRHREEPVWQFVRRRLETIAPKYWVVLGATVVALRLASLPGPSSGDLLAHLLLVHAATDRYYRGIDGAWWFVSAIAFLYLSYCLVRPLVRRGRWALVLSAGLVFELLPVFLETILNVSTTGSAVFEEFLPRVLDFYIGAAAGTYLRARREGLQSERPGSIVFAVTGLLGASFVAYHADAGFAHTVALGIGVTALGLMLGAAAHDPRTPWPFARGVIWLSTASYELYLVHDPLIGVFNARYFATMPWPVDGTRARLGAGMVLGLLLTAVLAEGLRRFPTRVTLAQPGRRRPTPLPVTLAAVAIVCLAASAYPFRLSGVLG